MRLLTFRIQDVPYTGGISWSGLGTFQGLSVASGYCTGQGSSTAVALKPFSRQSPVRNTHDSTCHAQKLKRCQETMLTFTTCRAPRYVLLLKLRL